MQRYTERLNYEIYDLVDTGQQDESASTAFAV
jgi:hypothetical protein